MHFHQNREAALGQAFDIVETFDDAMAVPLYQYVDSLGNVVTTTEKLGAAKYVPPAEDPADPKKSPNHPDQVAYRAWQAYKNFIESNRDGEGNPYSGDVYMYYTLRSGWLVQPVATADPYAGANPYIKDTAVPGHTAS